MSFTSPALALVMILGASVSVGDPAGSGTGYSSCPGEYSGTRQMVLNFLTLDAHAPSRQETGTTSVNAADLRVLTDSLDAWICERLNTDLGGAGQYNSWQWSYYTAGGFYFVAIKNTNPLRLGVTPVLVYDGSLTRVGGYAL